MTNSINIIICGTGGQGVLYISNILSKIFVDSDYDIKVSEIHGMSKRGGSVNCEMRIGEKIYSPIIEENSLDYLLDLDSKEYINYYKKLQPSTLIITTSKNILENYTTIHVNKKKLYKALYSQNIQSINYNITLLGILIKYLKKSVNLNLDYIKTLTSQAKKAFQIGTNYT